jgi:hypothetical protein
MLRDDHVDATCLQSMNQNRKIAPSLKIGVLLLRNLAGSNDLVG